MLKYIILLLINLTLAFGFHTSECTFTVNTNSLTAKCERLYAHELYSVVPLVQSHLNTFIINNERNGLVNRTITTQIVDYNLYGIVNERWNSETFSVVLL